MYIYVYKYICVYTHRERERETERVWFSGVFIYFEKEYLSEICIEKSPILKKSIYFLDAFEKTFLILVRFNLSVFSPLILCFYVHVLFNKSLPTFRA